MICDMTPPPVSAMDSKLVKHIIDFVLAFSNGDLFVIFHCEGDVPLFSNFEGLIDATKNLFAWEPSIRVCLNNKKNRAIVQ